MAVIVVSHRRDDTFVTRKKAALHSIHSLRGVFLPAEFDSGTRSFTFSFATSSVSFYKLAKKGQVVGIEVERLRWQGSYFDVEPILFPMT